MKKTDVQPEEDAAAELREECRRLQQTVERQRAELAAAHEHERQLEAALHEVTSSRCWRMTWPLRYILSKLKELIRRCPLFVLLMFLRSRGIRGAMEYLRARRYYKKHFPGKSVPAASFAPEELLMRQAQNQPAGPKISIVVPLFNTPDEYLTQMIDSVVNQTYENWELCLVDAGSTPETGKYVRRRQHGEKRILYRRLERNEGIAGNTNQGFALASGEYIGLLDHDDLLHPCALWYTVQKIMEEKADFVYSDEATFSGTTENITVYHFKPDFMLDNLRSCNYICHFSVFSRALLEQVGGGERPEFDGSQDYDLYLRLTEQAAHVAHVPHVMYYWRAGAGSTADNIENKRYCIDAAIHALEAHYERTHTAVDKVDLIPGTPGFYKTDYTIEKPGRVSILIPSYEHSDDLRTCVRSLYRLTTYPDFEVIVIENNSKDPATFACYRELEAKYPTLRVVTWQGKGGFNFSALNNFGAQFATGEYILMLNNDVEILTPEWLEEMVMLAQQKRIGCVGAQLFYPDDTVQHAGVGLGIGGVAGHLHKYFPRGADGYMGRMHIVQDVSAVTAACLLLRREVFDEVGGLDEGYAVAFNDVDFCVRVWKAGYQNVYTPFARLYHYESKSRGMEDNPEKQKRFQSEVLRFQEKWGDVLAAGDPCTNPNFDIMREDFALRIRPLP